ncbi:class I SAM-dependent methyltransferase [Rhodanobacter thiooxydans]|uniref:class I SAM-dependent methyltransferase n=1 Tax=Rhodanobacter thiooxydans TaxID=416169 RepID=UPI000D3903AE|nr:class I SAM-dependent methyltransferase [Rhodanobacter thiooxydans]
MNDLNVQGRDAFRYSGTHLLNSGEANLANYNKWISQQFVAVFQRHRYRSVLDFGAGIGSIASLFRQYAGLPPSTLEIDPVQADVLRTRGFSPIQSLDELSGDVDFIYTSNVLEHIEDDLGVLKQLHAKLSSGGRIAVFVPAFESIWTTLDDKVGHHRRYTKLTLSEQLKKAGFEIESIGYRDSIGFMLALVFKIVGSKSGEPSDLSLWIFDRLLWPVSQALDLIASPFFGKNVLAIARK